MSSRASKSAVLQPAGSGWTVQGPARLHGVIAPPGDKSIAHRAVLLAALSIGTCELRNVPDGDDVRRTIEAVRALGVRVEALPDRLRVQGAGLRGLRPARNPIDCGNSGTTMRLLAGLLAGQPFESLLIGDASLSRRPMLRVAAPLAAMGAGIECLGAGGRPPIRVCAPRGGMLRGALHAIPVDSAQLRSALLLAGLYASGPTRIAPIGASRDHTERLLRARGVQLVTHQGGLVLYPTRGTRGWNAFDLNVPGDTSSAAFFVAMAAAIPGARLQVRGVGLNPGRIHYIDLLRQAGARIRVTVHGEAQNEPWGDLEVDGGGLGALRLRGDDVVRCIDEIPALVVAAAAAGGGIDVRDAGELRLKESDRIAGLVELLAAFGARVEESRQGLRLHPEPRLHAARVQSHGDHRLAMAAALLATRVAGKSRIDDVDCVRTSYPGFAADLARLAQQAPGATPSPPARKGRPRGAA